MGAVIAFFLTPWIFITLLSVAVVINLILIEKEEFGWHTFVVVLMLVLLNGKYDILNYIMTNPFGTVGWIGGYFGAGLLWSFGKWYSKISKIARTITNLKKRYRGKWGLENFREEILSALGLHFSMGGHRAKEIKDNFDGFIVKELFPKASENKALITGWIIYWPFSLISTILNDPIRRFANWLYYKFSSVYESISNSVQNAALKEYK